MSMYIYIYIEREREMYAYTVNFVLYLSAKEPEVGHFSTNCNYDFRDKGSTKFRIADETPKESL